MCAIKICAIHITGVDPHPRMAQTRGVSLEQTFSWEAPLLQHGYRSSVAVCCCHTEGWGVRDVTISPAQIAPHVPFGSKSSCTLLAGLPTSSIQQNESLEQGLEEEAL